jgi:hypothetical protein
MHSHSLTHATTNSEEEEKEYSTTTRMNTRKGSSLNRIAPNTQSHAIEPKFRRRRRRRRREEKEHSATTPHECKERIFTY